MPIKMKILMDSFYNLVVEARNENNFEAMEVYSVAESYANNGHGMNDEELTNYVTNCLHHLLSVIDTDKGKLAVQHCLDLVQK